MWRRFLLAFAITGAASFGLVLALILIVDPLGFSPIGLGHGGGLALTDRRFAAPRLIESGAFDSFLVGSSTIHSVDPAWAEDEFGGRFASLAIHGGTPYEMSEMLGLIGSEVPNLRRVVLGIDIGRWCTQRGYARYNGNVVFPEWLYDTSRLNDLPASFNLTTVEAAIDQLLVLVGFKQAWMPPNGYRNQLIDAKWDASKAKAKLHGSRGLAALDPDQADAPSEAAVPATARDYPDLALLAKALDGLPPKAKIVALVMPSHISSLLKPDGGNAEACKERLTTVIARADGELIDFRIPSPWTRSEENFWDRNHFRVGLAHELITRAAEATRRRRDAEDGVYRVLTAPRLAHSADP